jgi:hypothetical protein
MDTDGAATFSGLGNIIYFFMDDFQTLLNHPPEAGSGLVDRIRIDLAAAVVPGPIAGAGPRGLILTGLGLPSWWRRRKTERPDTVTGFREL